MVSGEHVYCAMRSNMDVHYTWKLHLAYTALSLCGELYRRRQRLCSERECASSHYWLYPVATFELRLWWLLLKSFRFQGRFESHIIWDAPALVTTSCSGTTCDVCVYWETATFNNNVKWELMTSGSSHDALWDWVWRPLRSWRDLMRSGDGRRCSDVIISMALLVSMGTLIDGVTNIYGAPRRAWVMAFGRRDSVFVSVCLSQDGRSNHMLCLS